MHDSNKVATMIYLLHKTLFFFLSQWLLHITMLRTTFLPFLGPTNRYNEKRDHNRRKKANYLLLINNLKLIFSCIISS